MSGPTILCSSVAAACLTLAGVHLVIWSKDRAARANLAFAGLAVGDRVFGTAASFGNNYIQMPNGALGFHTTAGICVNLGGGHPAQNLFAAGNIMTTSGNPGTQVDCSTTVATVAKGTNCNANSRWSVGNSGGATTPVTYVLNMCN